MLLRRPSLPRNILYQIGGRVCYGAQTGERMHRLRLQFQHSIKLLSTMFTQQMPYTEPALYEFMPCHIVGKCIQHYPLIYNEDIF